MSFLEIEDLHVSVEDREILRGIDLEIGKGEVHAIMGRNGSGKTTLAYALMGHPAYEVTGGQVIWRGINILDLSADKRARMGLFLAFQYPSEVPGVSVANFLRTAVNSVREEELSPMEMYRLLQEKMAVMQMDPKFAERYLNEGFSGGEKKRNEILQMAILEPEIAILDETDSGLDIDALKIVASGVQEVRRDRPDLGVVAITHYQRLLDHLAPDVVHILVDGRIVDSGGPELAEQLEREGYDAWKAPA